MCHVRAFARSAMKNAAGRADAGSPSIVGWIKWTKDNWLLIAGITGGIGRIISFLYANFYKPSIAPANINVKLDMVLDPRVKDDELVIETKRQAVPV